MEVIVSDCEVAALGNTVNAFIIKQEDKWCSLKSLVGDFFALQHCLDHGHCAYACALRPLLVEEKTPADIVCRVSTSFSVDGGGGQQVHIIQGVYQPGILGEYGQPGKTQRICAYIREN